MNTEDAIHYLPLVTALIEGKTIQHRNAPDEFSNEDDWEDIFDPSFMHHYSCYRVKPQPREWVCYVSDSGFLYDASVTNNPSGHPIIAVREVL